MVQKHVSVTLEEKLVQKFDKLIGDLPRSIAISRLIEKRLTEAPQI